MMGRILVFALLAVAAFGVEVSPQAVALSKQLTTMEKAVDRHFRAVKPEREIIG